MQLDYHQADSINHQKYLTMGLLYIKSIVIEDILVALQIITNIAYSSKEVAGLVNLGDKILIFNLKTVFNIEKSIIIVIEYQNKFYDLTVNSVSDILNIQTTDASLKLKNISKGWQILLLGIFQLAGDLLIILDINKILYNISGDSY